MLVYIPVLLSRMGWQCSVFRERNHDETMTTGKFYSTFVSISTLLIVAATSVCIFFLFDVAIIKIYFGHWH